MKRWKKIMLGTTLGVVGLTGLALISADSIAAGVVRTQGTATLGVKTAVRSVSLGIIQPRTTVHDLVIENPSGFDRPHFVQIESAMIEASLATLVSDRIEIPLVEIDGLMLDLEQIDHRLNADVIVKHVQSVTETGKANDGPAVELNIGLLRITNIRLYARGSMVNLAGGTVDATIPSFEMKHVGTDTKDGRIAEQIASLSLSIVLQHIAENPVEGLSGASVGAIATALEQIPGIRQIGVGKALLDVNAGVNDGIKAIGDGLRGIAEEVLGGHKHSDEAPESQP
ncbi:MAG: hypothetical protein MK074_03055 [Phycisphaerales bacterium]|nr:hypothetical protein [Phycisphaerales bacterium]